MWNQDWWTEKDYDADELDRFPKGAGFPGRKADWGWVQIVLASLKENGRAAIVLDTGAPHAAPAMPIPIKKRTFAGGSWSKILLRA
jgi:type I restriction-modification system DNA methylase subunit